MKNCRHVYRHICENLDGDLNSPQCRKIKKHLDGCPDCQAYLDSLKKTVLLYARAPVPGVTSAAHRKLHTAIKLELFPPSGQRQVKPRSARQQ